MKNKRDDARQMSIAETTTKPSEPPNKPDFRALLTRPLVRAPLPSDFDYEQEALHLDSLWDNSTQLHKYNFEAFVYAGGSGMVFKVVTPEQKVPLTMKLVRVKLYNRQVNVFVTEDADLANSLNKLKNSLRIEFQICRDCNQLQRILAH
jgi:hypothetical protein